MAQSHSTAVQPPPAPTAPTSTLMIEGSGVRPLRFAVSLTDRNGREVFRKQFASAAEADAFGAATADLCPDYKVASVDRIEGIAWERFGSSVTITASPNSKKTEGTESAESPVR